MASATSATNRQPVDRDDQGHHALPCQTVRLGGGDTSCVFIGDTMVLRGDSGRAPLRLDPGGMADFLAAGRALHNRHRPATRARIGENLSLYLDGDGLRIAGDAGHDGHLLAGSGSVDQLWNLMALVRRRIKGFTIGEGDERDPGRRLAVAGWPAAEAERYEGGMVRTLRDDVYRIALTPLTRDGEFARLELHHPGRTFQATLDSAGLARLAAITAGQLDTTGPSGHFVAEAREGELHQALRPSPRGPAFVETTWQLRASGELISCATCVARRADLAKLATWGARRAERA